MAKSKFLEYQDTSGTGLIDECEEIIEVEEPACEDCKCIANGAALAPNWRLMADEETFLNEKNCLYQVAIETEHSTTISETLLEKENLLDAEVASALTTRYEEYTNQAVEALLDSYNKATTYPAKQAVKSALEYTDYYLAPRAKSRLKLLYSVPFDVICSLGDAIEASAAEIAEIEAAASKEITAAGSAPGDVEVTYTIQDLKMKLIRVRKGLHLYGIYAKRHLATEGEALYYQAGPKEGTPFHLSDYGDMGWVPNGGKKNKLMAKVLPQLDKFLNDKGYNIRGVAGSAKMFGKTVDKVTFKFNKFYELKKLTIYTVECGEQPIEFPGRHGKLLPLKKETAWKDPTAMAYLTKLDDMERALTAREAQPWLEFVKEYTHPKIYTVTNRGYENTEPDPDDAVGKAIEAASCLAQALMDEGKQLGQDIFDPDFNISDIFVEDFQKELCQDTPEEVREQEEKAKIIQTASGPRVPATATPKEIKDMALAQAFETLGQDDAVFGDLCALVMKGDYNFNDLVEALGKIRLCGATDMMKEAIECLMGGLTLEEALSNIAAAALRAMAIEDFGNFFVGLPPEKQAELDALVKRNFENGEFFRDETEGQKLSDSIAGKNDYSKPWENIDIVTGKPKTGEESNTKRTILQQLDFSATSKNQLDPNTVIGAYIIALMEVYADNYLELMEELNKFPGAQFFSDAFAAVDCPAIPVIEPSFFEWINDKELPACGGTQDWEWPKFTNPFGWLPEVTDWSGFIFDRLSYTIRQILFHILTALFIKICEIIGGSACGRLGAAGAAVGAIGDRNGIINAIKDSICGDDVSDEQIDDAVVNMFAALGLGAGALADTQQVMDFAADIGGSVTTQELCDAFLGEPSREFNEMVGSLIKYEYPDFEEALNNHEAIGTFFKNMGNLMPASFKDQLKICAAIVPETEGGAILPVNPSLCITEEQVEQFCDLRAEILAGRATDEQIQKLCERPVSDLEDLVNALQKGPFTDLPPLVSDPGCDNGLLPYESDEQIAVATGALNGLLEQLKIDFAYDMLGNGPRDQKWGLVNMILSDTMGNPFTAHTRKVDNRRRWVDFYINPGELEDDSADDGRWSLTALVEKLFPDPALLEKQRGAYPYKVAAWLQEYMSTKLTVDFSSSNELLETETFSKSYEELGIKTFEGDLEKRKLPNLGYNVDVRTDFESKKVKFDIKSRKKDSDLTLSFRDNLQGLHPDDASIYSYGFDLEFYLSDLTTEPTGTAHNLPNDNVRIKIIERINDNVDTDVGWPSWAPAGSKARDNAYNKNDEGPSGEGDLIFEFLATDNTLEEVDLSEYPSLLSAFATQQEYIPQVVLLHELIGSSDITIGDTKDGYDEAMSSIVQNFITEIAGNDDAFLYGATYDDLAFSDVEYVVAEGQTNSPAGTSYYAAEITDDDGEIRKIKNRDQILGVSQMQLDKGEDDNRVVYLDPMTFGGSYMNPPLYIKPLENKAWLGFIDVMFPDLSPCKPYRTDLIDFEDIQQKIDDTYASTPEDERLKSDPNCIEELPYARILERPSAAGLEGLITSAIRIYVSTYFIQSMATFTKVYPKFPESFSNVYAAYIVEEMEASFKDAQKAGWEFFNPFKDSDFWYAFLEQSVQLYDRRYRSGELDPPTAVIDACVRLNNMQEEYRYPQKRGGDIKKLETLKHYRKRKNLDAIKETEDDAKVVLRELVIEQLNYMGEKFVENLKTVNMEPAIYNLDHHLLQSSQGGDGLKLNQEYREEYALAGEDTSYTSGGEFAREDGSEYVGYYHVDTDDDGNPLYITGDDDGEDAEGDILFPMVNITTVPIGDVEPLGYAYETSGDVLPFLIEKYIYVEGSGQLAPSSAVDIVKAAGSESDNISDIYPGTLKLVTDRNGKVVGTEGELGVRYGLRFSIIIGTGRYTLTEVEVDSLDLKVTQVDPFEGDSKLLLCLINKLTADDRFKLVARYIFPMNKITAMLAVYNGLAFLPSIGEKVVPDGDTYGNGADLGTKPGVSVSIDSEDGTATISPDASEGAWAGRLDRDPGPLGALGFRPWDKWSKLLLRNSKSRIKRIFKSYYNSRDFRPGDTDDSDSPGTIITNEFKERFKSRPGQDLLPWWKARMLRTNPFNANGEMCEEKD